MNRDSELTRLIGNSLIMTHDYIKAIAVYHLTFWFLHVVLWASSVRKPKPNGFEDWPCTGICQAQRVWSSQVVHYYWTSKFKIAWPHFNWDSKV